MAKAPTVYTFPVAFHLAERFPNSAIGGAGDQIIMHLLPYKRATITASNPAELYDGLKELAQQEQTDRPRTGKGIDDTAVKGYMVAARKPEGRAPRWWKAASAERMDRATAWPDGAPHA